MRKATLTELNVIRKTIKYHLDNIIVSKSEVEEQVKDYENKVNGAIAEKLRGLKINDLRNLLRTMYTDHYLNHNKESWQLSVPRRTNFSLESEVRDWRRGELRKIFNSLPHIEMQIVRKEHVDLDALIDQVDAIVKGTPRKK